MRLFFILIIPIFFSCGNNSNSNKNTNNNRFEDGIYCANVEYFYSKTGTNSNYVLEVEIEDNEISKIFWSNGGWLDDSHFNRPNIINSNARFESDREILYNVKIIGKQGTCIPSSNSISESELIKVAESLKIDGLKGEVIWDSYSCDYIIIYTEDAWYVVAQKYSGTISLNKGDIIRGDLVTFGFEDVVDVNTGDEMSLYIDNYYAIKSSAWELIVEKCELQGDY